MTDYIKASKCALSFCLTGKNSLSLISIKTHHHNTCIINYTCWINHRLSAAIPYLKSFKCDYLDSWFKAECKAIHMLQINTWGSMGLILVFQNLTKWSHEIRAWDFNEYSSTRCGKKGKRIKINKSGNLNDICFLNQELKSKPFAGTFLIF